MKSHHLLVNLTLAVFVFAAPALALNNGGGSDAMGNEPVTVTQAKAPTTNLVVGWNGGGSNAMNQAGAVVHAETDETSRIAQWDGGGSNAMNPSASKQTVPGPSKIASTMVPTPNVWWNGGGSNAMNDTPTATAQSLNPEAGLISIWDGGGSNANQSSVVIQMKEKQANQFAQWNGGGSNAMNPTSADQALLEQHQVLAGATNILPIVVAPWDGGGSNAMNDTRIKLACTSLTSDQLNPAKNFQNIKSGVSAGGAANSPSQYLLCSNIQGNDLNYQTQN